MYLRTMGKIFSRFSALQERRRKALAVLLDPDHCTDPDALRRTLDLVNAAGADFIFVGGSLLVESNFHSCVREVKALSRLPVVLFPGSASQVDPHADALLFLSLISGRNADLLIGQHVAAAPALRDSGMEVISTGYLLIDGGKPTAASYISQTVPVPADKPEIAAVTAMAGEMLGLSTIYLDAGSGASVPISGEMIAAVRHAVKTPLIVGGGIRTEVQAAAAFVAGADVVVVGTAFEDEPELLFAMAGAKDAFTGR